MTPKSATTALVAILAATLACGGKRAPEPSAVEPQGNALLVVRNDHWLDITIYAIRGGSRYRLGMVSGLKTDTLPLQNTILAGSGTLRFLLEPIGSTRTHLTESIPIGANQSIELNIRNPLDLTTFTVSHRVSNR